MGGTLTCSRYDVIVIGAGVVGSLIARALSRYRLRTLLMDKASDVGEGTTKANTGIVHAGYDAQPGSLKARLNVAGNAMFDQLCSQLVVDFERCGSYVVAISPKDRLALRELYQRGLANGVNGLNLMDAHEMRRREPAITDQAAGALHAATGGIVDPCELCIAAAENAVLNGVELALETEVLSFARDANRITGVVTNRGAFPQSVGGQRGRSVGGCPDALGRPGWLSHCPAQRRVPRPGSGGWGVGPEGAVSLPNAYQQGDRRHPDGPRQHHARTQRRRDALET